VWFGAERRGGAQYGGVVRGAVPRSLGRIASDRAASIVAAATFVEDAVREVEAGVGRGSLSQLRWLVRQVVESL